MDHPTCSPGGTGISRPSTRPRCRTRSACCASAPWTSWSGDHQPGHPRRAGTRRGRRAGRGAGRPPGPPEGWDGPRLAAEIERIAAARPTAVNLSREVAAVAARIRRGQRSRRGRGPGRPGRHRRGQPPDQRARRRLPAGVVRGRPAARAHALQHRRPGLPGLGHGARGHPRAARRGRAQPRHRGRDPAAAAGRPADLLGARPARHRAPARLRRRGAVPDQPGPGRRGGRRRRPDRRERRRGQQDRHLQPGPRRPPGGHPVPRRGARVDHRRGDGGRDGDPARAARRRGGHGPGRAGGHQGAQLRLRHHPGRAGHRGGHRGPAHPPRGMASR